MTFWLMRVFKGNYRWVMCALLFLATSINYVDRQILSLIKPILDVQLKWNNEQYGDVTAAFQAAYAVGLLAFGWFIDRYGTKVGYAVSITAWSLAAMGHALVFSIGGFFVARIALGLGEGGNFPSAVKVVATWFPRKERAFATSIFNSGSNVGALFAPALVPWLLSLNYGWQLPFVVAGAAGLCWLFLWWPLFRLPTEMPELCSSEAAWIESDTVRPAITAKPVPWIQLFLYPQAWAFLVAKALTDPIWWFYLTWLPDYFNSSRGLDIKHSWILLFSIYSIITVLSIFGGWLTGYLIHRGWSVTVARKLGMFLFAAAVLPVCVTTRVGDWGAVLLIGFAGAAHQAWSATIYTTVSDMFPKGSVSSVTGLGSMAGSLMSIPFPICVGMLLDHYKALGNETTGYTILFGICSGAYLLAFALNHLLAPKFTSVTLDP